MALQSATAVTALLSLLFSRLDAHRKRISEPFDFRGALFTLLSALWAWGTDAAMTDQAFQEWVDGQLDEASAIERLHEIPDRIVIQRYTSEQVLTLLRDDSEKAQNLRLLLNTYQPELLTLLETVLVGRRELIDELVGQLPALQNEGSEAMRATANKLHRASEELQQAAERVRLYIQKNFPWDNVLQKALE